MLTLQIDNEEARVSDEANQDNISVTNSSQTGAQGKQSNANELNPNIGIGISSQVDLKF